jgi:predicted phosphate transport protein (TIGR00153 family)
MLGALLGKDKMFYEMFEKAADNTSNAANLLHGFFNKFASKEPCFEDEANKIKDLEHLGDQITHQTIEMLNRTFVTPLDREDIYLLVTKLDDVLDLMDGAASRIQLYKIQEITPEAIKFAEVLKKAGEILKHSITSMRNIKDYKEIVKHCIEIHTLENEGDKLLQEAMMNLFEKEKDDPIKVIKWKEIYQDLESATDRCEDVANIIEGIVLKYA